MGATTPVGLLLHQCYLQRRTRFFWDDLWAQNQAVDEVLNHRGLVTSVILILQWKSSLRGEGGAGVIVKYFERFNVL